jgi:hypothetical protein
MNVTKRVDELERGEAVLVTNDGCRIVEAVQPGPCDTINIHWFGVAQWAAMPGDQAVTVVKADPS